MKHSKRFFWLFIVTLMLAAQTVYSAIDIKTFGGGPVRTELGYDIAVNDESGLSRTWYVFNDDSCPIQLGQVGIKISYNSDSRSFHYYSTGEMVCREYVNAFDIRFVLFDVWGEHISTLSSLKLKELWGTEAVSLNLGPWYAFDHDVISLLTTVAFVARVRKPEAGIWQYDTDAVLQAIESIKLTISKEALAPTKDEKK